MAGPIRWGILGTGLVARDFAEGLRALPDARLQAVASRSAVKAESFARAYGFAKPYASYADLVRDPDVDVVYVATPNHRHKDDCLLALEAGKPVLCEKPFALSAAEARTVIAAARRKRLFCMEAMWMRFLPVMSRLRELIKDGAIGEVRTVAADLGFPAPRSPDNRFFSAEMGGGAWLDLGIYPLSFAHWLLGKPDRVVGQASADGTSVDVQSAAVLGYGTSRLAVLSASLCSQLPGEAHVFGTRGTIRVHAPLYRPHKLSLSVFPEPVPRAPAGGGGWRARVKNNRVLRAIYFRFEGVLGPLLRGRPRVIVQPFTGNGYNYEAAEVMRCLRAGELESPIMPLDETLSILETLDAIRGSR